MAGRTGRRLLIRLGKLTRWVAEFVLRRGAAVEVGEHRLAVGGGNETGVGNPKQTAGQTKNDGKEEDDVQPRQGCVVFGQVQIDDDLLLLSCQRFSPLYISCSLLLVQTRIA